MTEQVKIDCGTGRKAYQVTLIGKDLRISQTISDHPDVKGKKGEDLVAAILRAIPEDVWSVRRHKRGKESDGPKGEPAIQEFNGKGMLVEEYHCKPGKLNRPSKWNDGVNGEPAIQMFNEITGKPVSVQRYKNGKTNDGAQGEPAVQRFNTDGELIAEAHYKSGKKVLPDYKKTIPNVSFDFKAAVKRAYKDYPQLRKNTTFYDVASNKVYGRNPLLKGLSLLSRKKMRAREGGSEVMVRTFGKVRTMIAVPGPAKDLLYTAGDGSFVFDHELGHLLDRDIFHSAQNKMESAADAFAIIRHFQRFGADSAEVPKIAVYRAWEAVQGSDTGHLSSPVIARIWADRHTVNFASLSPAETWQKAREYVDKYALSGEELQLVRKGYNATSLLPKDQRPRFGQPFKVDTLQIIEMAATTCLTTPNSNVFLVGAAIVVPFAVSSESDPAWDKVVDKLQQRAQQLNISNILDVFRQNTADATKKEPTQQRKPASAFSSTADTQQQRDIIKRLLGL